MTRFPGQVEKGQKGQKGQKGEKISRLESEHGQSISSKELYFH